MGLFRRNGPSGFSSSSTAEEVTNGIDGSGLTAIVTGASSGIGSETARVLALRGVNVIMGVRNMVAGNKVKEAIVKEIPAAKVDIMELDLSSLASVRKFASEFTSSGRPLNLLINNAGMASSFKLSEDNIELHFATNHLAREMKREGRIVNVSSEAHRYTYKEGIRFKRLNDKKGYKTLAAYGQSKLANILHCNELARRLKDSRKENDEEKKRIYKTCIQSCFEDGVLKMEKKTANSLHPGAITTNLFRGFGVFKGVISIVGKFVLKDIPQGASTSCYVALHPQVKGISGKYFSDSNLAKPSSKAADADLSKKLWEFSMDLIK